MTSTSYYRHARVLEPMAQGRTQVSATTAPPLAQLGPSKARIHQSSHVRKQKPVPFDPDDLCRRLEFVLSEERAYAERKRRSRANLGRAPTQPSAEDKRRGREVPIEITAYQATAAKSAQATAVRRSVLSKSSKRQSQVSGVEEESPQPPGKDELPSYHHVPRVAAAQFARTTAAEPVIDHTLVHKLSRKAMKFHMDGLKAQADAKEGSAPDEQAKTLHRIRGERERTYGRNQFQHPAAILEAAAEVDDGRNRETAYRQTFDTHFQHRLGIPEGGDEVADPRLSSSSARHQRGAGRDSSDFPVGAYPVLSHESADAQEVPARIDDHRVDWTQSDEKSSKQTSPTLKKSDTKWKLRARLSFHRGSKTAEEISAVEDLMGSPPLRSQRSSFFARFKR